MANVLRRVVDETDVVCPDSGFIRELQCAQRTLRIHQLYIGDEGCVVWDAALVLARFLENERFFPPKYWKNRKVLELGSGTGAVGLASSVLG